MALPPASDLVLTHPDPSEHHSLFASTADEWKGALTASQYIKQCAELVSLDSEPSYNGLQHADWILVDGTLPIHSRAILSSCETFRKRVLVARGGVVEEKVVFGIASVFTAPKFRRRGYAKVMLRLLAERLEGCIGTLLFSDIGKRFYCELGWVVLEGNRHLDFPVVGDEGRGEGVQAATPVLEGDLEELCAADEAMVRKSMAVGGAKMKITVVPDREHMAWHHMREDFICRGLFGKAAEVRGAISGAPGKRVWVVWTRKYDSRPDATEKGNTLYILRVVIEKQDVVDSREREEVKENLRAVIESSLKEAEEWKLSVVRFWDPSPLMSQLVKELGLDFVETEREDDGIASLRLNGGVCEGELEWLANERYAWC